MFLFVLFAKGGGRNSTKYRTALLSGILAFAVYIFQFVFTALVAVKIPSAYRLRFGMAF